ncbi:MAG: tetratricopeptide repeat protein [Nonlabens sp.]
MKNLLTALIVLMQIFVAAQDGGVDDNSAFAKANKAYTTENYDLAIAVYKQILESGQHSAELYFNLGNAFYKKNEIGESIYYLEKARQLNPDDPEIKNNLAFANRAKIDSIEALPENAIGSNVDDLIRNLSIDEWAYLSIVIVLITLLLAIFYIYAATSGKKRLFFILMVVGILFSALTIMAAFYARDQINSQQFAIVMIDEIVGREAPKQNSNSVFTIHEGTKIEVIELFEDWAQISLANGSKAWLPQDVYRGL